MLGHYKAPLHRVFDPVARLLLRMGARPNHLTVLGLGVSVAAAYVFSVGRLRWAAVLLAVAGLFDFFDGAVARLAGSDSDYGAFLDSVVDRYSDVAVLLGVLVHYQQQANTTGAVLTMATLAGTVMTSYTKARAQSISVRCDIGVVERPERLIALIAGATFHVLTPVMALLAVLTNVTALQRIIYTRRIARDTALR
ncbi:MAG TPA: CDP-alcohol phosphatidyltransferase family protein [Methylomirabilota bacterium]|jgi:phosphatidylglycerophosphate synthase|nr:CDP-alcohol phosphatidyltransferase family protein [Methylomirabilota bacterium]